MQPPLTAPEIVVGFLPVILPVAAFIVLPKRPDYGFTESGKRYRKADSLPHVPLLGTRTFWLLFGACLGGASAWALAEAIVSAVHLGTVSLPGRRGHPRPVVPWGAAWAYLSGLTLLLASTIAPRLVAYESSARFWLKVVAALFGAIGYVLVLLSFLLSSWKGAASVLAVLFVLAIYGQWRATRRKRLESTSEE